jgi:hypothetical protein
MSGGVNRLRWLTGSAWVSYLDVSILIGTLAIALFNTAKDAVTRYFAYTYAIISVGVMVDFFHIPVHSRG